VLVLEAAGYDPLRAREIYEQVDQVWWERFLYDRAHRIAREAKANG
jgi:hypothetical protein